MVHRLANITLYCLLLLILMGAIVRVTGSGLGCPDWPTCWGCVIPPTSPDQIDVDQLDLEKFKKHAERKGLDPESITRDSVIEGFDPVRTWIEFLNRLTSLPLGLASLSLAIASFWAKRQRRWVVVLSWLALLDILVNAILGAIVVRSGLQPGVITLHMALAFLLIMILVTVIWMTRSEADTTKNANPSLRLKGVSVLFFVLLFAEGLMGSQVREQTDEFMMAAERAAVTAPEPVKQGEPVEGDRSAWIHELEQSLVYKVHRSFSWALLVTAALLFWWSRGTQSATVAPRIILGLVLGMMVMGIIMAHIAVYPAVQVAHVLCTAILLALTWHWLLSQFSGSREMRSV